MKQVKRTSQKKKTVRKYKNQKDSNSNQDCNLIIDLHEFESDKDKELKKIHNRMRIIQEEIEYINSKIRSSEQTNKCTEDNSDLQHLSEKLEKLSHEKHTEALKLLYFPYEINPNINRAKMKNNKIKIRNNEYTANFVNLKTCRRLDDSETIEVEGDKNNINSSVSIVSNDSISSNASAAINSTAAISFDKMVSYYHMFAGVTKDKKSDAENVASVDSFDFNIEEFGVEVNDIEHIEPLREKIIDKVEDNIDTMDTLSVIRFNTKDLLRRDLKSKSYFSSLCKLSDQYKRFYVLIETLKHKIQVLNKIGAANLKLSTDVQNQLWESSKQLIEKITKLERSYRKLFQVCGLKEIEELLVLPYQLRPYENCYRFIETTALKKFIHLLARQTQLIRDLLRDRGLNNNNSIDNNTNMNNNRLAESGMKEY